MQEWLQGRINEANSLNWNLNDNSIPNTKIFSYTSADKEKSIGCLDVVQKELE